MGRAVNALSDVGGGYTAGDFDVTNTITVDFYNNFQPDTITEQATQDGGNLYIIGSELCYVRTWTRDNAYPNRWIGSNMIRRGKNTQAVGHLVGDRVIFFTDAVKFLPIEEAENGIARQWKFATSNELLENVSALNFTWRGGRNTESNIPIITPLEAATNTIQNLNITNYTTKAKFREIQIDDNNLFGSPTTISQSTINTALGLGNEYQFTRSTNLTSSETFMACKALIKWL